MVEAMVTTNDNPYDPFVDFDNWYAFDQDKGYQTCAYLSRIVKTSDELSVADQYKALETAVDAIVIHDILGIYKKVTREI